jgi:hypothetical protein
MSSIKLKHDNIMQVTYKMTRLINQKYFFLKYSKTTGIKKMF